MRGMRIITAGKLKEWLEQFDDREDSPLVSAAIIEWTNKGGRVERGVAMVLGENLAHNWQSGDVMVFWSNGDHTLLIGGEITPETELKVAYCLIGNEPAINILDKRVL